MADLPAAPADLTPDGPGHQLWTSVTSIYDLRPDEAVLLTEACLMVDELVELRDQGDGHAKRMAVRAELRRYLSTLGLSDDALAAAISDTPEDVLARRRAERETEASRRARRAAQARWARES